MNVLEYKCPNCGAPLHFDAESQTMLCDSCDGKFDVDTAEEFNEKISPELLSEESYTFAQDSEEDWSDEMLKSYTCPSCGGEIVGDMTLAATHCPYCGNPAVISSSLEGKKKPSVIIPFKTQKKDAEEQFKLFCKGKKLLPNDFKQKFSEISGVYVPFWLFDCHVDAEITYTGTRTHAWSDSKYNYVRTDYFRVYRAGNIGFENISVDGSSKADDAYMESITPFRFDEIKPFDMAYLPGFMANSYDVSSEQCKPRADERIRYTTSNEIRNTAIGYTSLIEKASRIRTDRGRVRQALLPVWMMNSKYKNKLYSFAMNGQTGNFVGELPIDRNKMFKWFAIYFAIFMAVTNAIAFLVL